MENGENEAAPRRAFTKRRLGLACAVMAAGGVLIGAVVYRPELTAPTASDPTDYSYVTEPVTFPVDIPGCPVVEPPEDGQSFMTASYDEFGYDHPSYPWFSGPKAVAMTQALQDALPSDVEIAFADVDRSLLFQPIFDDPPEYAGAGGWTGADGTLLRGDRAGALSVTVRESTGPIPPCVAGDLDERRQFADGTIVDIQDTWFETEGVRTLSRTATGYLPDGSVAHARATDAATDRTGRTPAVALTIDELIALVTAPGLRVTAPVPPGTPNPPESCDTGSDPSAVIDQDQARRWDAVLASIPLDGITVDLPLGALRPSGMGGVCQTVRVTTPGQQSRLSIAITTGRTLPQPLDNSSNDIAQQEPSRQLPDGSIIENSEWRTAMGDPTAQPSAHTTRFVTVTRPSGTRIQVSSYAEAPAEPVPFALLEAIASAPELEVS